MGLCCFQLSKNIPDNFAFAAFGWGVGSLVDFFWGWGLLVLVGWLTGWLVGWWVGFIVGFFGLHFEGFFAYLFFSFLKSDQEKLK